MTGGGLLKHEGALPRLGEAETERDADLSKNTLERVYRALTAEDDGRVCLDIPESACNHQPRNFLTHIVSLGATKTADGLIDPKLVLAWLLTHLGAPDVFMYA